MAQDGQVAGLGALELWSHPFAPGDTISSALLLCLHVQCLAVEVAP